MHPNPEKISGAAQLACLLEASSYPKPGNVSPFRGYAGLTFPDFLAGAVAIGPAVKAAARAGARRGRVPLGRLLHKAARDTLAYGVGGNVNAGIILLLIPLAAAYARAKGKEAKLADAMRGILSSSTPDDAVLFYRALRALHPKLPKVKRLDVFDVRSDAELRKRRMNFKRVLEISHDEVAREVLRGFPISRAGARVFRRALKKSRDIHRASAQAFLWILAWHADGLIEKKVGREMAEWVSRKAREVMALGGVLTPAGYAAAKRLDDRLFSLGQDYNPGSTADLTCSSIFLALAEKL